MDRRVDLGQESALAELDETLIVRAIIFAAPLLALSLAVPATAEPCQMVDTCKYLPDLPGANGPIQNTWDVPGIPPGATQVPLLCSPFTYRCEAVA